MSEAMDPAGLNGDALTQWYLRSPADIEQERQAAAAQRYQDFFGGGDDVDPDPGFDSGPALPTQDVDPGFSSGSDTPAEDIDPGFTWVPAGANRWRSMKVSSQAVPSQPGSQSDAGTTTYPVDGVDEGDNQGPTTTVSSVRAAPPARPDPNRTDVFQPGADGKLQPIPGWHTTGPFDFPAWSHNINWEGVGNDLGNIASRAIDFMTLGAGAASLVKELGHNIGPAVVRGIVQGHHPWPRFMGGPAEQELSRLHRSLHTAFHGELGAALKEAGFPRVGGIGGATEDWAAHFKMNPGSFEKATDVLRDVTRNFDKKNGTSITRYLDKALPKETLPPSTPGG